MASRVVTQLVSDLSGDEIVDGSGESIEFAYRGVSYSIDLTEKEAAAFDESIAPYLEHAARRGRERASHARGSRPGSSDAKAVREWARGQGIDVPDRGRIPSDLRQQYDAAH